MENQLLRLLNRAKFHSFFAALFLISVACKPEKPQLIIPATPYTLQIPSHFPEMKVTASNPMTVEGVALGRMLYYDTLLSKGGPNNGLSCSSCHFQSQGFTVPSAGVPVLHHANLGYSTNFLWNGKVSGTLEDIMRFEVNDVFKSNPENLRKRTEYASLSAIAYGSKDITNEIAAKALAQFFRTLVSGNSKFDKFLRKEIAFTQEEITGLNLFFTEKADCFHCHTMPLMSDYNLHNIGLDSVFTGLGMGKFNVTGNVNDMGLFRTPSLRNATLRKSFMHDGRFKSLEEVIDFYNSGLKNSATLDPIMYKTGGIRNLNLSPYEKTALLRFLETLTDTSFTNNKAFSNPF